jgi:hypothetical protein
MSECRTCKYNKGLKCKAFPDGIPHAIISSEIGHDNPIDGDHGIVYQKDERSFDKRFGL